MVGRLPLRFQSTLQSLQNTWPEAVTSRSPQAVMGSAERPLKSHNGVKGTSRERAPRLVPATATGCAGIPVTHEAKPEADRWRGPLAVVGRMLAMRKGLRPTLLVARRLRWERQRGPFESQWRRRQLEP